MNDRKALKDKRRFDAQLRGDFAVYATELDLIMNEIISYHYCQDETRRTELIEMILSDLRFDKR